MKETPAFDVCLNCGKNFETATFSRNLYKWRVSVPFASVCERCDIGFDEKSERRTETVKITIITDYVLYDGYRKDIGVKLGESNDKYIDLSERIRIEIDDNFIETDTTGGIIDRNVESKSNVYWRLLEVLERLDEERD